MVQIGAMHDHAALIMETLKKLPEVFEVVAYAIPKDEVNVQPESYSGVSKVPIDEILNLPNIDAAIIETSEKNLTKYALMAAEKELHIHMDKPGGMELSEFEKLINSVKQKDLVFHLGYMYRYNSAVIDLMKDLESGKLGEIYSVEAQMNCMHTVDKRKWLSSMPSGMLFFLGCHLIDLIYRIQGEPQEIIPLSCATGIDGVEAKDYGMVALKYKNGISFAKSSAIEPCGFMRRQLVVTGSKGTVQLLPFEAYAVDGKVYTGVRKACTDIESWVNDGEKYNTEPHDRYEKMMVSFAEYINGVKQNPYSYDYELNLYKLILKCCEE